MPVAQHRVDDEVHPLQVRDVGQWGEVDQVSLVAERPKPGQVLQPVQAYGHLSTYLAIAGGLGVDVSDLLTERPD